MNHASLIHIADQFWARTGGRPAGTSVDLFSAFHRQDVWVIEQIAALSIARLDAWLSRRGIPVTIGDDDRRLHGCALAFQGAGMLFLDRDDTLVEQRFTLAHELAHLLLDYYGPRQRNVGLIGARAAVIFDGAAEATTGERLAAALSGEDLTPFIHLMTRDRDVQPSVEVSVRERRADRLACELLAPMEEVGNRLWPGWTNDEAIALLVNDYGLPDDAAEDYLPALIGRYRPAPTFVDWLAEPAPPPNLLPFTPRTT